METGCGPRGGGRGGGGVRRRKEEGGSSLSVPMAFAPPKTAEGPKLQLELSAWTPLSHQAMNDRVFEERRALLGKWFDKWTDGQRRRILVELLECCSLSQQKFCAKHLQARVPTEAIDFTTRLPRVLSLYIFSFLDPRSLCRCAQVSWGWKQLAELDQLWMLKCLRLGWLLSFCPSPLEQGVWKRLYIAMVAELSRAGPRPPSKADSPAQVAVQPFQISVAERKFPAPGPREPRGIRALPPWRCADRKPRDTIRYNFLDNCQPGQPAQRGRRKGGSLGCCQLRKVKSSVSLSADPECVPKPPARPRWATAQPGGALSPQGTAQGLARSCRRNGAVRPGPGRAPEPRDTGAGGGPGTGARSPSPPPFEARPWHIPSSNHGSDTE